MLYYGSGLVVHHLMQQNLRQILIALLCFQLVGFPAAAENDIGDHQSPGQLPKAFEAFFPYASEDVAAGRISDPELLVPGDVPEAEQAETEFSAEMDVSQQEGEQTVREVTKMTPEEFEKIEVKQRLGIFSRLMMMGHGGKLKKAVETIMNRLQIEGDRTKYEVRFSPSLVPNASIYQGRAIMNIHAGLIAYSKNVDELAFVIAHEMTHDNQEQLKVLKDKKEVEEALNQVAGYADMAPAQREEIRADLGAVERVIKAGYNPWAGYDFLRKMANFDRKTVDSRLIRIVFRIFSKKSFDYWEAHPASEIRMAAIKGYIVSKSQKQDLADNLGQYQKFPTSLNLLRYRLGLITFPLMNVWTHRALYGYWTYCGLDKLYQILFGVSASDTEVGRQVSESVIGQFKGAKETIGAIFKAAWEPVRDFVKSSEAMRAVLEVMGTGWGYVTAGASHGMSAFGTAFPYLLMGGMTWFTTLLGRQIYRSDPQYKNLVELKEKYTGILTSLTSKNPEPAQLLELTKEMAEAAGSVEKIYKNGLYVRWAQDTNKLLWIRLRLSWIVSSHLDILAALLKSDPKAFSGEIGALDYALEKLPGYILESPIVSDSLALIAQQMTQSGHDVSAARWFQSIELRKRARGSVSQFPKDQQIDLAYDLWSAGMKDSAYRVTGLIPERLVDYAYSSDNSNPARAKKLGEILRGLKEGQRSLGPSSWFGRKVQEGWITSKRLLQITDKLDDRLTSRTFTQSIPYPSWRWISPRNYVDMVKWASPNGQLDRQFKTLSELRDFADRELVSKNANMPMLSNLFVEALKRNPNWLSTEQDIEALFNTDYFWPVIAGTAVNFTELEKLFADSISKMISDHPRIWKYEPSSSEKNHQAILTALHRLNKFPADYQGQKNLWLRLTSRGVTSASDSLFGQIYERAGVEQRSELEGLALTDGRIWEPDLKVTITRSRLSGQSFYHAATTLPPGPQRLESVKQIITFLEASIPERGRGFAEILEEISVKIRSTPQESKLLHDAKTAGAGGEKQEDLTLRVLSDVLNHVVSWKKKHQWEFVLYLRGDIEATPKLQAAFRTLGPERIRRMFQLLPVMAKTVALDSFLDAPTGLLGKISVGRGWSKKIVDHLMRGKTEAESRIAREILTGFLYALKATGNKPLQSYVLSYMLSLPKSASKNGGEALKNVLEIFGTTGIKIGQFLAASNLLPDAETAVLRTLQEQAKIPMREEIYEDLRSVLGTDDLPFDLKNLLGAASLKYAMLAGDKSTGDDVVLKVLRLESIAHTRLEFKILEKMAEYLVKKNGSKYGIFGSITTASRRAVERELKGREEVNKGRLAARYVYVRASDLKIKVVVPQELMLKDRIIVSEFAEGTSFFNLRPEVQPAIADKILQMEHDILMSEKIPLGDEIIFDPDRHAGNYRIHIQEYSGEKYVVLESATIRPIDFGQLLRRFTPADRDLVIHLFALAQIADKAGAIDWLIAQIGQKITMTDKQKAKLAKALRLYFPSKGLKPVTAYYGILSALEIAGLDIDIKYYDFVRAIIQLKQYEPFATKERTWKTPSESFEAAVLQKVDLMRPAVELTWRDKLTLAWRNPGETYRMWRDAHPESAEQKISGKLLPMPEKISDEEPETCEDELETGA